MKLAPVQPPASSEATKRATRATCSGCHGVDKRIVGPPMTEIAVIYSGNPEGIVKWATEGFNQHGAKVIAFQRSNLVRRSR